jgi:hypothetical protein
MDKFFGLFSDFTFKDWFALALTILVSFGILIYQRIKDKKKEKNDEEILRFISDSKEKESIETILQKLKKEQINIELQIKEHIPQLARQSVLKEQKEIHERALYNHYKEWKKIKDEVILNSTEIKLEKTLEEKLVHEITPKFELINKLDDLKTKITLSSIIIALTSTFIASPFNLIITVPLLVFIFKNLQLYLELKGVSEDSLTKDFRSMYNAFVYVLCGGFFFIMISCVFIFIDILLNKGYENIDKLAYLPLIVALFIGFLIWDILKNKDIYFEKIENSIREKFNIIK